MTGSRRLYVLAFSCLLGMAVLLALGARAWATATVHRTEARCGRVAASAIGAGTRQGYGAARTEPGIAPRSDAGSWRVHTLRAAGCSAWREVHDRMRHRHHGLRQRA